MALFGVLADFALGRFTKSDKLPEERTPEKRLRNRIYVACGIAILACLALTGAYHLLPDDNAISGAKPVSWLESLMIWAFGISWFIKGQTLWQDKRPTLTTADAVIGGTHLGIVASCELRRPVQSLSPAESRVHRCSPSRPPGGVDLGNSIGLISSMTLKRETGSSAGHELERRRHSLPGPDA